MRGLLLNKMEMKEVEYLIKRELDEILFDLQDERIDMRVKDAMQDRYKKLFGLLKRIADPKECFNYMWRKEK